MNVKDMIQLLEKGAADSLFAELYGEGAGQEASTWTV